MTTTPRVVAWSAMYDDVSLVRNDRGPDFSVRDSVGRVVLFVEAKAHRNLGVEGAIDWRREGWSVTRGVASLLVTPETMFFWSAGAGETTAPVTIEARAHLGRYLTAVTTGEAIDPQVFAWVVSSWLEDVLEGTVFPADLGPLAALLPQRREGQTPGQPWL